MAARSQIGNIDQEFFPSSIYYVKGWAPVVPVMNQSDMQKQFWSFFGSSKGEPQEDMQNCSVVPVMIFNPNQSFGNRIANIAFAQGSQNLQ